MQTTKRDILIQLEGVNDILTDIGANYRVKFSERYGYSVLERVDPITNEPIYEPLVAGTKKECHSYAMALLRGMWMSRGDY